MDVEVSTNSEGLMTIEAVQKVLNRSRASVYRYANTDPDLLNPPYDPTKLNPELRQNKEEALMFHPNEVSRFAGDELGIKQVRIEVRESAETATQELLRSILTELQRIRVLLERDSPPDGNP
ncbi:MAG: resolvase [Kaiparowitsia implicata GSE-PSE-MK54-09C]|nr:resolvase [Kaiparowitsia implicata GSE-PSE-MK54-09C]